MASIDPINSCRVLIAAGGTGGHLFPAEALASELQQRGWQVYLATDARVEYFSKNFPATNIYYISSAPVFNNPLRMIGSVFSMLSGIRQACALVKSLRPSLTVGFGGYPSVPPVIASFLYGIPCIIHEQNAVMGKANKLLSRIAKAIALGLVDPSVASKLPDRSVIVGNPVRPAVLTAAKIAYSPSLPGEDFRLLVFGGSQGARFFSEFIPAALALLPFDLRKRLRLTQQVRPGEEKALALSYAAIDVEAEISLFFLDLPHRIAQSHLVISRSGASSVSEIAAIGRPAVFVPYPHSRDGEQLVNALGLSGRGAAETYPQSILTPEKMASVLFDLISDSQKLAYMASAARNQGKSESLQLLADLSEYIALGKSLNDFKKK